MKSATMLLLFTLCIVAIITSVISSDGKEVSGEKGSEYPFYYDWDKATKTFAKKTVKLPADALSLKPGFEKAEPVRKFRHFAQARQDLLVLNVFKDKSNGYFVDLAANHWLVYSNTYVLEHFNYWKGICLEPNPKYWVDLLSNRRCMLFVNPVSTTNGEVVTFSFGNAEFGGIVGADFDNKEAGRQSADLITVTLEEVLEKAGAPKVIDYFSLDVEGAEYHVLSKFDFSKYTFLTVTVERPSHKVHRLLTDNNYRYVYMLTSWGECFYIHTSLPNFKEVMTQYHVPRQHNKNETYNY